ncbi:MAG: trigger factor [Candidatus Moraniibacteriota bacterium]|nr:MAG: trigger factor [Candidatus Moranbacteria bacterium]
MEVNVKKLPESRLEITVTLPWEVWGKHEAHAAEHMAEHLNLPGFRKGKVPHAMLEARFGREAILVEAAEHAVHEAYPKALVEAKAEAIGRPEIGFEKVAAEAPLIFTIKTDILPEIILSDWKKAVQAANKQEAEKGVVVEAKEIEAELERLASMRATFTAVDRPAQEGDSVKVDFLVKQDGVVIEGGQATDHALILGSKTFIPGFEEAVIGMKTGEEKEFTLNFPAEYHAKHLAGKPAQFTVTLKQVEERTLPTLDDAFAQSLGKFQDLAALRKNVESGMLEEKKQAQKEAWRGAILDALVTGATLDYPAVLVQEELERMIQQFKGQVSMMGFQWDTYLAQTKKTEDELRADWTSQAKKRIAAELILQKIATDQEITVDTEAVEAEMNKVFQYYKSQDHIEKNIDMSRLYTSVRGRLTNEKTLEYLEKL